MPTNQGRRIPGKLGYRSVYNGTGSTIAAGTCVKKGATKDYALPMAAITDVLLGVAVYDIPTLSWGEVQQDGVALVLSGGALATVGTKLMSNASGKAAAFAASGVTNVLGLQNEVAAGADELIEVDLAGPAVSENA